MVYHWFKTIFASTGDKTAVPNTDPSGYVAYDTGYPLDYQRVLGTDPLAKPIERDKLNQVLYDATSVLHQYQVDSAPEYIDATANGGTAYAYAIGAIVIFTDGKYYENTVAGNTSAPNVSGWIERGSVSTATHNMASDADYTLSASENKHLRIIITDTGILLTTARNIVVDNTQRRFLVLNSTLQTLTFKTSSGTGIAVAAGKNADLLCDGTNVIDATSALSSVKQIQYIDATVATNALTVYLNPTTLDFRSATLTDGTITTVTVSSQITLTVPSGATLGTANGIPARLAILAINNAGTAEVAIINTIGAGSLSESGIISTTAISAAATASNVYYSTTARTNVAYRVVGYIEITEATAGTWATAPTLKQGIGGRALLRSPALLAERIITGAAVTSVDFSGLDISTHKSYRIEIDWVNNTANTPDMYCYINGDTTLTNYHTQIRQGFGSTINTVNQASPKIGTASPTSDSMIRSKVMGVTGSYARVQSNCSYNIGTGITSQTLDMAKDASVSNITQLTFATSVVNCISPGTVIRIYIGDV